MDLEVAFLAQTNVGLTLLKRSLCFWSAFAYIVPWHVCFLLWIVVFVFIIFIYLFFVCQLLTVYVVLWKFNLPIWPFNWVHKSLPFTLASFLSESFTIPFSSVWSADSHPAPFSSFSSFGNSLCSGRVLVLFPLTVFVQSILEWEIRTKRRTGLLLGVVEEEFIVGKRESTASTWPWARPC